LLVRACLRDIRKAQQANAPVAGRLGDHGWSGSFTKAAHVAVIASSVLAGIAGAGWLGFDPARRPSLSLGLLVLSAIVLDLG
jgi:hypothetical protein